jgi:FkbH-like protein
MYETEANQRRESEEQIPAEVIAHLAEARRTVVDRTVLPWSEHCTECVWPTCYSTCDLYSPREDGRCRRFVEGMVRVSCSAALNDYVLRITFKRWGKLWTPGNIRLRSLEQASRIERRDLTIGTILHQLPAPIPVKKFVTWKRYSLKKRLAYRAKAIELKPTSFLLECYNPGTQTVPMSLTIRTAGEKLSIPFQQLFELAPGFQRVRVPFNEIAAVVDLKMPFNVELIPNHEINEVTLYFGLMDFVREAQVEDAAQEAKSKSAPAKVKCVVWDLDNTVWDGILVEDGPNALRLKQGIKEIIEELDRRGILQSIASKNNADEAMAVLKRVGLDEFFLVPQISWLPKSEGMKEIARRLNIGLDSLLFIDDSEFELQQVSTAVPKVRTIGAARYRELVELEECRVPETDESRERRKMYRVEEQRQDLAASFANDYVAFLRHCDIRMKIRPMTEESLERVHELTQRTNQMNFSGNRYDRKVLGQVLATPYLDTYVIDVEDRFGTYGVVGFSIVDSRTPLMTDLMFSCRIQAKRVEHAFLAHLIREYISKTGMDFQANYRKTDRNAPSGKVFADIGMQEIANDAGVSRLVFSKDSTVPDEGLVKILVPEPSLSHRS